MAKSKRAVRGSDAITAAAVRRLENGEITTLVGLRLNDEDARALAEYAQHMSITPTAALRELFKLGLSADPMSAVLVTARYNAYQEMRQYAGARLANMFRELANDVEQVISGDPNATLPPGYKKT